MSRNHRVLCGTPEQYCTGGHITTDQQLNSRKAHVSHSDAFKCHARYLVRVLGFTRLGAREFVNPENGYVRVLTKQSRFGGLMVSGKEGRHMPEKRRRGGNRGVIVG